MKVSKGLNGTTSNERVQRIEWPYFKWKCPKDYIALFQMKVSKGLKGPTSNKSVQMIELDTSKGLNIITTLKNALKRLNGT